MANEFDWNYEETKRDFEPEQIPNGDYRMIIRGAEKAMSKDIIKPKKMIKLKLGVSGYAKSIYHYIVFLPDNREVTNRNLTNFFRSFGIQGGNFNLDSYLGKEGAGRVEIDSNGYEKVKYFLEGTMKDRLPAFAPPAKKAKVEKPKQEEDDIPF
mgnify:FL=1